MFIQFPFRIFVLVAVIAVTTSCSSAQTNVEETAATENTATTSTVKPDESKSWATLGRLYVVTVTDDTLEGIAGKVAQNNGQTIETLFKNNIAPGAFAVIKIPAEQITRQTIFSVISNLPIKSQDAICLYVAGKGKLDRKYGTFFELNKGKEELYRSELRSALAKKNCRLNILISDFCDGKEIPVKPEPKPETTENTADTANTEQKKPEATTEELKKVSETEKPETAQTETTKPEAKPETTKPEVTATKPEVTKPETTTPETTTSEEKKTAPLFFALFFQSTGVVDIISSNPVQQSLPSDRGVGCFTETFSGILDTNKNKGLSWFRLFPYIARGTGLTFENIYVDGAIFGGLKQVSQSPILLTLGQENYSPDIFSDVYPRGNNFDAIIPGVTDKEIALTDADRKTITQLIQETFSVIRPQNDQEKGTHENFAALDPDNTVNGIEGNPFSTVLPSLRSNRSETPETSSSTNSATTNSTASVSEEKMKFGVRAVSNNGDGVRITEVVPSYPGAKAGLEVGDIILSISGKKITSEKEYSEAVDSAGREMKLEVRNKKGGNVCSVIIQLTAP
jgi:sRNA-binding protein